MPVRSYFKVMPLNGEGLPDGQRACFPWAVGFTLVAAYQWAGSVGGFGSTTTEFAVRDWQSRVEHRSRRDPLAGLVFQLGNTHA